ncbi:glutathione S-transferase family protein [Aerophototrophica crusticola]|uniref:Glutathione S-transferase family protein n=1 Tax=Aerophototrophica crusticola TaxID=1709002 RepID=A0A858R4Y5_9PROT|nr:glutathione S-transferase family protein [Rhodospirillaceae bacterium B3]
MITIYGMAGSPYVSRVLFQVRAKGLEHTLKPAPFGTPEFKAMNPIGKVPVLDHDGFILPESAVICEYLEDAFPTPSLLGTNPQARAKARLVGRTVDLYCQDMGEMLRAGMDPSHKIDMEAARARLDKGLDALEVFLADDAYAAGPEVTLADCTLVGWLFYARMFWARGNDDLATRPKLRRYVEFVSAQPLVQQLWSDMDTAFRAFLAKFAAQRAAQAG